MPLLVSQQVGSEADTALQLLRQLRVSEAQVRTLAPNVTARSRTS